MSTKAEAENHNPVFEKKTARVFIVQIAEAQRTVVITKAAAKTAKKECKAARKTYKLARQKAKKARKALKALKKEFKAIKVKPPTPLVRIRVHKSKTAKLIPPGRPVSFVKAKVLPRRARKPAPVPAAPLPRPVAPITAVKPKPRRIRKPRVVRPAVLSEPVALPPEIAVPVPPVIAEYAPPPPETAAPPTSPVI